MTPSLYRRGARLLIRSVRTHPRPAGIAIAGTIVFAATAVLGTVALGDVTDSILVPAFEDGEVGTGTIVAGVAVLMGLAVARTVGVVVRRYYAGVTAARMAVTMREELVDRFTEMPLAEHRERPTGELLAHADSDVEVATEVLHPLPFSLGVVALIVFSLISLALVDPWLLLIGLAVFPALTVLNRVYTSRVERPAAEVQAAMGQVASVAHESIEGALVVKTLGREREESARLGDAAERLRTARWEVGRRRALFEPTLDALPNLGIVALVAVGSWRIGEGVISEGDLVQSIALFQLLAFPMRVLGYLLEELPRSVVARDRIDRLMSATTSVDRPVGRRLPDGPVDVEAWGVGFGYEPGERVLAGLDLELPAGTVTALVGSTGSGKSTLCALLAGLEHPDDGTIAVGGVPLDQLDPATRTGELAIVFQEAFLFGSTVRDNIVLDRPVDDVTLAEILAIARVDRVIEQLPDGLDTVVGERGVTLSGGQRQRVALARALVGRPRVLLLDDATSAVDPAIEEQILTGLRRHLRATTLIVAQRPSTIRLADRVVHLDGGRIAAVGRHEDLLRRPAYEALVRAYENAGTP